MRKANGNGKVGTSRGALDLQTLADQMRAHAKSLREEAARADAAAAKLAPRKRAAVKR